MPKGKSNLKERLLEEVYKYGFVVIYLYVCFSVLLLYKTSILSAGQTVMLPYGTAIVKALVIGKFILIGEALKIGHRAHAPSLLHRIAWRSFLFLLMLVVLNVIEEVVIGWVHGRSMGDVMTEISGRAFIEQFAPVLVMLLTLIPLITITEINRALGPGEIKRLLTGRNNN